MLNGYDISDNQGNIDNSVVPGDFVIIKATEGVGYTDPDCDANYQQAKAAGKLLGVYHFARPDGNQPEEEARWFVSQVQGYIGEAVLVLDFETGPLVVDWAKRWLDTVYSLTQVRPWIYMNQSTANGSDWSPIWKDYALWLASYGINAPQNGYTPSGNINVNGDWTVAAWQYTSQGRLPNWGGFLDLDVFYGDATAWNKYAAKVVSQPVPEVIQPAPVILAPVTAPEPTPAPVTKPVENIPAPTPTPVVEAPVQPKTTILGEIVGQLESNKTILMNVVVTFVQAFMAAWATTNFSLDKLTLAGAWGAGLSAVYNLVIKPSAKALMNK